jgi:hypothetical protein
MEGHAVASSSKVPPAFVIKVVMALRGLLSRTADRLLPAPLAVAELGHQFARAHVLATMWKLGVADALGDRRVTAAELAGPLDCDAAGLHRLLRAAATFGAVRMGSDGRVSATRLTRVLRSDDAHAAGAWCSYLSSPAHQRAWGDLAASVRTGEPAFGRVHRQSLFAWFDSHPEEGDHFTRGLAGLTLSDAPFVVGALDLPEQGVVCDLAGGQGVLLAEILSARPQLRGVLVESEAVLRHATAYLGERGLLDRVELITGDIFAPLDVAADLYLLKWILHDWDDATCVRLLKGVAATMPPGSRLAVVEGLQEPNAVDPRFSMVDLEMLVVTEGGRERSAEEIQRLMSDAGLAAAHVRRTAPGTAVLSASA